MSTLRQVEANRHDAKNPPPTEPTEPQSLKPSPQTTSPQIGFVPSIPPSPRPSRRPQSQSRVAGTCRHTRGNREPFHRSRTSLPPTRRLASTGEP